jgi:hypothetical protein
MKSAVQFVIPVEMVGYNGQRYRATMGPFEHTPEREFALTVNKKAIEDCSSLSQLKPVAQNLLEGWSSMQTALQSMMLENIQLRQALAQKELDLRAADELMNEAAEIVQRCGRQSAQARRRLWPW